MDFQSAIEAQKMNHSTQYWFIPFMSLHFVKVDKILLIVPPVEEVVFLVSIVTVCAIVRPQRDTANIHILNNKDNFYNASLIALNFAFTGSVTTMSLRERNPSFAWYCRRLAVVSAVIAAGVLTSSVISRGCFML